MNSDFSQSKKLSFISDSDDEDDISLLDKNLLAKQTGSELFIYSF